jgi:hypothetical protein
MSKKKKIGNTHAATEPAIIAQNGKDSPEN